MEPLENGGESVNNGARILAPNKEGTEAMRKQHAWIGVLSVVVGSMLAGLVVAGSPDEAKGPNSNPRFVVGEGSASNCVVDTGTGLMWLRNPDAARRTWSDAMAYCKGLDGTGGRGGHADWRLPTVRELQGLIDYASYNPALPSGHPFLGVQSDGYWSSTASAASAVHAWYVQLNNGSVDVIHGMTPICVWPVRAAK